MIEKVSGAVLFISAFAILDGAIRARLYKGEPMNPNFRPGYAINRFRGRWELRVAIPVAAVAALALIISALAHAL
jgi:hypothetical protein